PLHRIAWRHAGQAGEAVGRIRTSPVLPSIAFQPQVIPRWRGYDGRGGTRITTFSTWTLRAAAALCLAGYVFVYAGGRAGNPIRSDGFSYYVYLPSWFLFHDTTLSAVARDCCGGVFPAYTAIIRWPGTRRWVNAHPIGDEITQAPLFAVAHA